MFGKIAGGEKNLVSIGGATTCTTVVNDPAASVLASGPTLSGPAVKVFIPAASPKIWMVKVQNVFASKLKLFAPTVPLPGIEIGTPTPQLPVARVVETNNPAGKGLEKLMPVRSPGPGLVIRNVNGVVVANFTDCTPIPFPKCTSVKTGKLACASPFPAPSIIRPAIPTIKRNLLSMFIRSTPFQPII